MEYWEALATDITPDLFCSKCGEEYLGQCPSCSAPLSGSFVSYKPSVGVVPWGFPKRPSFCGSCGAPYPWVERENKSIEETGFWSLLHPEVTKVAKPRFESGQYSDAVEAVFKRLNTRVKVLYREVRGGELDGSDLMRKAFRLQSPVLELADLETQSGRNIQEGFLSILAGAMQAIRNPHAHEDVEITANSACHSLMLGSMLFERLDTGKKPSDTPAETTKVDDL